MPDVTVSETSAIQPLSTQFQSGNQDLSVEAFINVLKIVAQFFRCGTGQFVEHLNVNTKQLVSYEKSQNITKR